MSSELVKYEDHFAVLKYEKQDLEQIIADNIGGDSLSEWDLDKVKVPSGGGTAWQVPTLEGEQSVQSLEGVIIHWGNRRAYWPDAYGGGSEPPDCSSRDGIIGHGDPGGECVACPHAQFGSADDGVGQACKATRVLFLLTPESLIPIVITLPPASLANAKKYFLRLVRAGVHHTAVVTKLVLVRDKSKSGITFSRVELTAGERLSPEAAAKIAAYADQLKPAFERVGIERDDLGDTG